MTSTDNHQIDVCFYTFCWIKWENTSIRYLAELREVIAIKNALKFYGMLIY